MFSDNIFALRKYAVLMGRPFIYGGTSHQERTRVLHRFKTSSDLNTVFLSKVCVCVCVCVSVCVSVCVCVCVCGLPPFIF